MTDLKWLDGYSGQSTDELIDLERDYRSDSLALAFEQAIHQKMERVGPQGLSDEERVILAVEALEREVNNGGYGQFFTNSSKEFAPIIVGALQRIGSPEASAMTEDALSALGLQGPISVESIDEAMEEENDERDAKLDDCATRYYTSVGDLSQPLLAFIKANANKIRFAERSPVARPFLGPALLFNFDGGFADGAWGLQIISRLRPLDKCLRP